MRSCDAVLHVFADFAGPFGHWLLQNVHRRLPVQLVSAMRGGSGPFARRQPGGATCIVPDI